jgi:hypothetical protein
MHRRPLVTDSNGWQPPASAAPDSAATPWTTPAAQPAPGLPPAPVWQQQGAPGWTPPPKPGLIPLHPLGFGTIIGSSFRVMRRNPAPTFGLSVLLYGFVTIVYVGLIGLLFAFTFSRLSSASYDDTGDITAGSVGLFGISTLVPTSLALVATALLQGIISLEVSRATLGEKLRIRGLWRLAKGRLGTLVLWSLLLTASLIVFVVIASVAMGAIVAITAGTSSGAEAVGAIIGVILVTLLVGLAFAAIGSWLGIKTALVPCVIVLERRGHFWRTLGAQLLIGVIVYAASYIVSIPITLIGTIVATLVNPNADDAAFGVTFAVMYIVLGVVTVVVGAIGLVMQSASLALIYIDIRMRTEGLDLELLQYVEAKQSGSTAVESPYLRLQGGAPAAAPTGSPWA